MRLRGRTKLALLAVLGLVVGVLTASAGTATGASAAASSLVPLAGTGSAQTGDFTPWDGSAGDEFAGGDDEMGPAPFDGTISLSPGSGQGGSTASGKKAKSNPTFNTGFEGLNFYQQRYARGGNQFSVEPPDQALCVGNGYVLEAVNDVLNIYDRMKPEGVIVQVLKSACASIQSTRSLRPWARQWRATAVIDPIARLWSPPSITGMRPAASSAADISITARFQATTSSRWR